MKFDYDLFMEILCLLPVETLLRFRCLSKTCRSCIDTPEFINLHLNRSIKTNTNRNIIIHELEPKGSIYTIDLDSLKSDRCPVELHMHRHGSDLQFYGDVVGSFNGLLAVYNGEAIVLWNPATRKHKTLPRFWGHCYGDYKMLLGFGYDAINDDYKVIVMIQHYMENNLLGYSIIRTFRINADSYNKLGGVLVSGSLHWVVNLKGNIEERVILAFGVRDEKFSELPKPEMESGDISLYVEEIGGRLLICSWYAYWRYEIWIMKEYGVMESWTKLFYFTGFMASRQRLFHVKALCCLRTKSDDEIFLFYDHKDKYFFFLGLQQGRPLRSAILGLSQHNISSTISANICIRSLVRLTFDSGIAGSSSSELAKQGDQENMRAN